MKGFGRRAWVSAFLLFCGVARPRRRGARRGARSSSSRSREPSTTGWPISSSDPSPKPIRTTPRAIVLDVNSPGGLVEAAFAHSRRALFRARAGLAYVGARAYSAAALIYALGQSHRDGAGRVHRRGRADPSHRQAGLRPTRRVRIYRGAQSSQPQNRGRHGRQERGPAAIQARRRDSHAEHRRRRARRHRGRNGPDARCRAGATALGRRAASLPRRSLGASRSRASRPIRSSADCC